MIPTLYALGAIVALLAVFIVGFVLGHRGGLADAEDAVRRNYRDAGGENAAEELAHVIKAQRP